MAKGKDFLTNIIIGGKVSPTLAKAINQANQQNNALKKIGNAGKAIGKATLVASTAAAAGIVAISKSAIESYAEYEQLVGGVDTLFKENSQTVQQYANQAYKTAGLSANAYMETVTSFSASLLQSLDGDTAKAAKYADQAIIDMSDNANKMGTSMDVIQQTFQSLAKGNYAMLDNLKLGYGGTKTEMQRLLKEAEKLTGVKYDISKFGDVTQAIHAIQAEMGISGRTAEEVADIYKKTGRVVEETLGTTAKEASTTIQGSFSAMKSAWQNLITGVANENADFDALLSNFIDSIGTVAENLLPRISIVIGKIPSLVTGLLPLIPPMIEKLLPAVLSGVSSILSGVGNVLPALISSIASAIGQIVTGAFEKIPTPLLLIGGLLAGVTAGIKAYTTAVALKNAVDKIQEQGVKKLIAAQIAQNAAFLASPIFWIVAGIVALVAGFVILWKKCEGFRNFWIGLWEAIKNAFFVVVNWIKENWQTMLLFLMNPLAGVFKYCYDHFEGFRNTVNNVVSSVKGFFVDLWTKITEVFGNIGGWFSAKFNAVKTAIQPVIDWISNKLEAIKSIFGKVKDFFSGGGDSSSVPAYASGGTVTRPHLAVVGDAPETIVPHGNTPRNRALLAEAAANVTGGNSYGGVNITYAPVIQGGSGADVRQALKDSETEFERKMDEYFRKKGRVSFA